MDNYVVAIVPAAGIGSRFGADSNKLLVRLMGKPIIVWTLEALEASERISEIIPVLHESDLAGCSGLIETYGLSKVKRLVPGGAERQDSVINGLRSVENTSSTVVIHDGARPAVTESLITNTLNGLDGYDGAVAAVPPKDTIKHVITGDVVRATLNREELWAVQTPQVFRFETIMDAYLAADKDGYRATDDATLVERRGGRVHIVMGSYENIKVTTPEDLEIVEMFVRRRVG